MTGTPARPRARGRATPLTGLVLAMLCAVLLAGCSSLAADPLTAASVDGQPISLAAYQRLLSIDEVENALQGTSITWLTPDGRSSLASLQQQTLDYLENALVLHEQVHKLHATVNPKDAEAQLQLYASQLKNMLSSDPNNSTIRQFVASVAAAQKNHPGSNDLGALVAGQPDIGGAFNILALQFAEVVALSKRVQVPQANVSIIIVQSEKQATDLKQQAENGADFSALAKHYSTDSTTAAKGGDISPVWLGKLNQNGPQFDAALFGPSANYKQSKWYVVVPFSGSFVLCQVTQRTTIAVSSIANTQSQQTTMDTWLALIARPAAHVQQYVAVDATPTAAPANPSGQ